MTRERRRTRPSTHTQAASVQSQLDDTPESKALDKIERLAVFEEVVRELEAKVREFTHDTASALPLSRTQSSP
eukprot:150455-Pleurochrysis_carterae.AAC.1